MKSIMRVMVSVAVILLSFSCHDDAPVRGYDADDECRYPRTCDANARACADPDCNAQELSVSILFVIDDSPGMCNFQHELRSSMGAFVGSLDDLKLRYFFAVVTTDMFSRDTMGKFQSVPDATMRRGESCLHDVDVSQCPGVTGEHSYVWLSSEDPRYLDSSGVDIPNIQHELVCNLTPGTSGSAFEMGLEATRKALLNPVQRYFVDSRSLLVIIFFSSDNDCSDGGVLELANGDICEWERERLVPVDEYVEFFKNGLDPSPRSVLAFGIVAPDDGRRYEFGENVESVCTNALGLGRSGYRYAEFIDEFGGVSYDICEPPYDGAFREIASAIGTAARQ